MYNVHLVHLPLFCLLAGPCTPARPHGVRGWRQTLSVLLAYHCGQMCVMKPAAALDEVAELAGEDLESLRQYSRLTSDIHTVKLT